MGHEAWISLSEKGKSKICKLVNKEDFDEKFKSSFPKLNEIDAVAWPFGENSSEGSFEDLLSSNRLVNAGSNYGSYSMLARSIPAIFETYCYMEFGPEDACCIITSDQGYVYLDEQSHTVEGAGALYIRFKDKYDELRDQISDLTNEFFNSNGYDFIYEHYYGK